MTVSLRQRTSVIVLAGRLTASDRGARALAESLERAGVGTVYLGREASARRIALCAAAAGADAIEVCIAGRGAVTLLRQLLHELRRLDQGGVSIVAHRIQ